MRAIRDKWRTCETDQETVYLGDVPLYGRSPRLAGLEALWRMPLLLALTLCLGGSGCRSDQGTPDAPKGSNPKAGQARSAVAEADAPLPTIVGRTFQSQDAALSASDQSWPSEAFAEHASRQLKKISGAVVSSETITDALRSRLFTERFTVSGAPRSMKPTLERNGIQVYRASEFAFDEAESSSDAVSEFIRSVNASSSFAGQPDVSVEAPEYVKFKVVSVDLSGDSAMTKVRAESQWASDSASGQTVTEWECRWSIDSDGQAGPRLDRAILKSIEAMRSQAAPWFTEVTDAVIGDTTAYRNQLRFGLQHWLARIGTAHGMSYFTKHGLSIADVNSDGLDDVYVCQPGGLPNRLFIQQADGSASEQAKAFGLDLLDRTASAVFVDLDNDGDQDAALATLMGVLIFENDGKQRFVKRQRLELPDTDLQGISAVDYDNDGDLDLYQIVDYASAGSRATQGLPSFVYHNANDGGANRLFENGLESNAGKPRGAFQFLDVTDRSGLNQNNQRHSLAAAWNDFDHDGDQDLYVANDYGPNSLFQNIGGRFVDIAEATGSRNFGSGMSVSWGDYDRDGQVDLYVGNMFSSAGSRLTTQREFLPNVSEANRGLYQNFVRGNTLLRRQATGFVDETAAAGVGMGRWSWSSLFADIDNDGWQDLLVSNGYITTEDTGDL